MKRTFVLAIDIDNYGQDNDLVEIGHALKSLGESFCYVKSSEGLFVGPAPVLGRNYEAIGKMVFSESKKTAHVMRVC